MLTIATPHGRTHFFASSARSIHMHRHFSAERATSIAVVIASRDLLKDAWNKSTRYCFVDVLCANVFGHDLATNSW